MMTRRNALFIAILLILSGIVVEFLVMGNGTGRTLDLPEFFAGFISGIGIAILLVTLFRRR
jgi:uncharacterized membrane protein